MPAHRDYTAMSRSPPGKITQGVHARGGHMAVQLWHTGRISHASLQPGGQAPVAPSAINAGTRTSLRDENGGPSA